MPAVRGVILPVGEVGREILTALARTANPGIGVEALPLANAVERNQADRKSICRFLLRLAAACVPSRYTRVIGGCKWEERLY